MIWFSCFCCASENFRSTPAASADSWMDLVLAVRHPLSAPTWAKPSVSACSAPPPAEPDAGGRVAARAAGGQAHGQQGGDRAGGDTGEQRPAGPAARCPAGRRR